MKICVALEDDEMIPENLDSLDSIQAYVAKKLGKG